MLISDVYMLDKWPCRMVELVAWVAGVDHKEKTMIVTSKQFPFAHSCVSIEVGATSNTQSTTGTVNTSCP